MQRGQIFQASGSWYVRYYEAKGVRRSKRIASVDDYPSQRSVEPLVHELMRRINGSTDAAITLDQFIESRYLPYTQANLRVSTYRGYVQLHRANIKGVAEAQLKVREYRTVDVQRLIDAIPGSKSKPLAQATLSHIKAFLSGVFRYAAQSGVREGNPVIECRLPKSTKPKTVTYAYSLSEIQRMLMILPLPLKALVATAGFAGPRRSELQGFEWADYDGSSLWVKRSVWRGHVSDPKSIKSKDYIPVIPQLKAILDAYKASLEPSREPSSRLWTSDLQEVGKRVLKPLMASIGIPWKGWHAFRRGIASNLFSIGIDDLTVQRVLRHAKVTVTRESYIKIRSSNLDAAMEKLSQAIDSTLPS